MGVITYDHEVPSTIPPAKLFKAFVLDGDNLIPKVLPQVYIKGVKAIRGDGGAGTIKDIHFAEGSQYKSAKMHVDELDMENFAYNYTITEGDVLGDVSEKISCEIKFLPADGGSIIKIASAYHTKGDAKITEKDIKSGKEKAAGIFKAVEAYLIANPATY